MSTRAVCAAPKVRQLSDEELIEETLTRDSRRLVTSERRAGLLTGGAFLVVVTALVALFPPSALPSLPVVLVAVLALAVAATVRYPIPSGYTVPTVLVAVPLLFMIDPVLVPLVTVVALILAGLPGVLRGRSSWERLAFAPANAWFIVGPAAVFAVAGLSRPDGADPFVLLLALAAMLASDFLSSAIRERLVHRSPLRQQAREVGVVCLIDAALAATGYLIAFSVDQRPLALTLALPLLVLMRLSAIERRARYEQLVELNNAYRGTALVLGDLVGADDAYTGEHTRGVVELALEVADAMDLDPRRRRNVEFGALLHDVGKVAIPKEIINKPGPLDDAEWQVVRTHTAEGHRMLQRVGGFMREVGLVVRGSHERWDGGGYPDGLRGEQIPMEARIVAACDTWSAMTTDRPYRLAMSEEAALAELQASAGHQLDPAVVEVLVGVLTGARAPRA